MKNFLHILYIKSVIHIYFLQIKYYFRITLFLEWFYLAVFMIHVFVIHVSEDSYWFSSFIHSVRTNYEKWSWWNSFIKINASFFIIIYDSHVLCSYSSYLIRSSNYINFIFHFMLLIKLTKYESSLFSIIMSYDNDTYLSIRSSFESHNKLIWNIKWTFISNNNSSSYD